MQKKQSSCFLEQLIERPLLGLLTLTAAAAAAPVTELVTSSDSAPGMEEMPITHGRDLGWAFIDFSLPEAT